MIWALIIGLIVGALAKLLMPGKDPGGIIITILLGVAGSVLANWVGSTMGIYDNQDGAGIVASIIGAMVLLYIYRVVRFRRVSRHGH